MHRTLQRAVWLTTAQRAVVLDSAHAAERHADAPPAVHRQMNRIVVELRETPTRFTPIPPDIVTTRQGLHLPEDALPVFLSDADIDALFEWGDLPGGIRHLAKPPICIYPDLNHITLAGQPDQRRRP